MSSKINNENDYLDILKTEYAKIIGKNPRGRYAGERWWLKKKIKEAKNEQTSSAHGPAPAVIPEGNMNADGAAMVLQSMNLENVTLRQQRDVRPADEEHTNTSDVAARKIQTAYRRYVDCKLLIKLRHIVLTKRRIAARKIQSAYRRYVAYKTVAELRRQRRIEEDVAAWTIQSAYHRYVAYNTVAELRRQEEDSMDEAKEGPTEEPEEPIDIEKEKSILPLTAEKKKEEDSVDETKEEPTEEPEEPIDIEKEKSILPFSAEKKKEDSPMKTTAILAGMIQKMKRLQKENEALKLQNQKYSSELDDFKSMLQKENEALKLQNQKYSSELDDFKSMLNSADIF